jgi:hypothetical protein
MLVVDLMHEFELGVWKALLTHLVRILHSLGAATVQEFNHRYVLFFSTCDAVRSSVLSFRKIASFGTSTIRRFTHNVADMKKLAARDFEDILQVSMILRSFCIPAIQFFRCQCCIPCFESLLPAPHNDYVLRLLYLASYWHSLAKLRLHSETTLKVLDNVTVLFARALRHFKDVTCPCFNTVETEREYSAVEKPLSVSQQHPDRGTSCKQIWKMEWPHWGLNPGPPYNPGRVLYQLSYQALWIKALDRPICSHSHVLPPL